MTGRLQDLQRVYDEEFAAAVVIDHAVVRREALAETLDSELFLVGQALARDTQRLSGLPYIFPGGPPHILSKGGRVLDGWLAEIGDSIVPERRDRHYAYHADLHPGFPGRKSTSGDVVPTIAQIEAGTGWLQREIEIIDPKAVICLGKQPALEILRRYRGVELRKLSEATTRRWEINVAGQVVAAFGAYPVRRVPVPAAVGSSLGVREQRATADHEVLRRSALKNLVTVAPFAWQGTRPEGEPRCAEAVAPTFTATTTAFGAKEKCRRPVARYSNAPGSSRRRVGALAIALHPSEGDPGHGAGAPAFRALR